MKIQAYARKNLVPIVVPDIFCFILFPNLKLLFLSTNSAIFNNSLVGMVFSSLSPKAPVSAVKPT